MILYGYLIPFFKDLLIMLNEQKTFKAKTRGSKLFIKDEYQQTIFYFNGLNKYIQQLEIQNN